MKYLPLTVALIALGLASTARAADAIPQDPETKAEIIKRLDNLERSVDALAAGRSIIDFNQPAGTGGNVTAAEDHIIGPNRGGAAPGSSATETGTKADISRRIDDLEKSINALAAEERAYNMDRMPGMDRGANQVQIVRQLAENMIVLYQQNLELKEQIAALKAKKS